MLATTAPAPTPTAPKPGIRKLNIGALATKPATTKTVYPILADPTGDIAKLAEDILAETEQADALEGSLSAKKGELRRLTLDQYFPLYSGKGEIPSSLSARTSDGREVLVGLINKYKVLADEAPVAAILGEELTPRFLRQKLTFKVDCDLIPEETLGDLYEELTGLFTRHGCAAALSATQGIVPTKDFHTLRHTMLTPAQNAEIDLIMPIQAQVKTKGRGNK